MQIKTRLRVNTLSIIIIFILILLSLGYFSLTSLRSTRKIEIIHKMRQISVDRILLRDDFIVNREERAARQWFSKTAELQDLFEQAATYFQEKEEIMLLQMAKADFAATVAGFSEFIELQRSKDPVARHNFSLSESEQRLVNQVFVKAYSLTDINTSLHEVLQAKDRALRDTAFWFTILLVICGGSLIIVNSTLASRLLTKRLATLRQGLLDFGAGNFTSRIIMDGEDELSVLAQASNEMAMRLQASYTSIDNLQEEIEERARVQNELQDSERNLSNLLEKLNQAQQIALIGSWEWNLQTNQVWWSEETYRIFGVTPHDFVPSFDGNSKFIHPDDLERYGKTFAHSLQTGEPLDVEFRLIANNGELKSIYALGQVLDDGSGKPLRFIGTVTDISEKKRANEKLLLLSNFNNLILDSVEEGILGLDMQGRHTFANPAASRMLGYEAYELIGQESHSLWHHTKADGSPCQIEDCEINTAIREGKMQHIVSEVFWRKAGTSFPIECICSPLLEQGRLAGTVLTFTDITARKEAEEKIASSLQEKDLLLKEIHHRVKNNLQIISSLLKLQANYIATEQVKEIFLESQQRITAMASVHTLLYKSQNFAAINLGDYVRSMASQLLQAYKSRTAPIALAIHIKEVMLPIDSAIPCGLLINELLTNALKYAFPGARKGEISVETEWTENGLRLMLADNGIGFPSDMDFRTTATFGLKLVQMLVKQLDGSIEQFSDNGTRYVIMFRPATTPQEVGHV